jgi:uncharacterized RDD family membrane protein YckC
LSILAPPLSGDPLSFGVALPPDRDVAALWRRFVAFGVDAIIVGVAASIVALPFFDAFSHLGAWGRLVGFFIALPYFAILNSKIGGGQTLGKRWMHIEVVDKGGNTIPFSKSVARYAWFAIPYYLNGIPLPTRTPWVISSLLSTVFFVVFGATLYLVLFNRRTRQGIHDLAIGSYVADADKIGPLKTAEIWKPHWAILGVLLVGIGAGAYLLGNKLAGWGPFPELLADVRLAEDVPGVQAAQVQDLHWSNWGSSDKKRILVISVRWTGRSEDEDAGADEIAKRILKLDPGVTERDFLRVVMIRGYDLGIAQAQITKSYEHTPADWNSRVFGKPPSGNTAPSKL